MSKHGYRLYRQEPRAGTEEPERPLYQPAQFLEQAEFVEHGGKDNILPHVQAALRRAREIRSRFSGLGEEAAHDLARTSL